MAGDWDDIFAFDQIRYQNNISEGKNGAKKLDLQGFDGADAYANQAGMTIGFYHVPSCNTVLFKAFITAFNESYSCDWASEAVFGRTDPIHMFKQNTRQIALNFKVPAFSESEAFENLGRVQQLTQFLYPAYRSVGAHAHAQTIAQSPLIRLKVLNLLARSDADSAATPAADAVGINFFEKYRQYGGAAEGVLGVIQSLQVNHNLEDMEAGSIEMGFQTVLPKLLDITVTFTVIHEKTLGWDQNKNQLDPMFPYGVELKNQGLNREEAVSFNEHLEAIQKQQQDRALTEQAIANAQARYAGLFGAARLAGDQSRLASGNATEAEQAYLASAVAGQLMIEAGFMEDNAIDDTEAMAGAMTIEGLTGVGG